MDDPIMRHSGAVVLFMCDTMLAILVSAGFVAHVADDDDRTMTVQVLAGPAE